jgi:hypothetical protein
MARVPCTRLIGPKTLHLTQGMHERLRNGIEDSWALLERAEECARL